MKGTNGKKGTQERQSAKVEIQQETRHFKSKCVGYAFLINQDDLINTQLCVV